MLGCTGEFGCYCPRLQRIYRLKNKTKAPHPHGERRGYQRHVREGTAPCAPCTKANNEYQQNYLERRRRGAA